MPKARGMRAAKRMSFLFIRPFSHLSKFTATQEYPVEVGEICRAMPYPTQSFNFLLRELRNEVPFLPGPQENPSYLLSYLETSK